MSQGVAGIDITEIDLSVYVPQGSNAIFGVVGPATKGAVDTLDTFTDEGNFVNSRGRPADRHHSIRAGIRYLRQGNQLKHARIAGLLLGYAVVALRNAALDKDILAFQAKSPGTWANSNVRIGIVQNGSPATSYDVYVYFYGQRVDNGAYANVTNATVAAIMANDPYVDVTVDSGAGTDFPDATVDAVTEQLTPQPLTGGDDGVFASTRSDDSSTGGIGEQTAYSGETIATGDTVATVYSGTLGVAVSPGTFLVIAPGPVVWTDDGEGNLAGAAASGVGFIDYATGAFVLEFAAAPTGAITASWTTGWSELAGTIVAATLGYTGTASRPGLYPGAAAGANKVMLTHQLTDVGAGVGAGPAVVAFPALFGGAVFVDGPTAAGCALRVSSLISTVLVTFAWDGTFIPASGFMNFAGDVGGHTLTLDPATGDVTFSTGPDIAASVDIVGVYYAVDDGAGLLAGYNVAAGTINYATGAWTVTFTAQPDVGTTLGLYYQHATILGTGDGSTKDYSGTLDEYPVRPGTVVVTDLVETFTDNGDGTLTGSAGGTGTVDYWTGVIAVSFFVNVLLNSEVIVTASRILAHVTAVLPGPIGNERTITGGALTDGFFGQLSAGTLTGTLKWATMFNDGTGAAAVETYDNLADLAALLAAVNSASEYVLLESVVTTAEPDVSSTQDIGLAGAFTNSDVVGAKVGATYTGLQLFANPDVVPCHFITTPGIFHRQVQNAGVALCSTGGRRCLWIHSIPDFTPPDLMTEDLPGVNSPDPVTDMIDFHNGNFNSATVGGVAVPVAKIPYPPLAAWNNSYGAAFGTWLKYYDVYKDAEVWEAPEGDVGAIAAFTDNNAYPWYPIAGENRGKVGDVVAVRYTPDKGERKTMCPTTTTGTPNTINPFVNFFGRGIFLYGQRTTQRTPTSLDRINVRWTLNVVENQLDVVSRVFPFEINDDVLWRMIEATARQVVEPVVDLRGFTSVRVVCDETTNTDTVISGYGAICKIFIQPALGMEELEYQMILTPQGVDFDAVAPVG